MWMASEATSAWPRGGHEIPDVLLSFSNHADVQSLRNPAVLLWDNWDIPNILANCSQGKNKDVSFSVGSVFAWNKNSWFQRQRIALFAFTQSPFSSLKCFRITPSVMPLWIQVVSQSMKLLFCLLAGKCKLSKLVFTIISPFLVPILCPPNPKFYQKPLNQQHSFCRGLCWKGDSGSRIARDLPAASQAFADGLDAKSVEEMWLSIKQSWFYYKQRQKESCRVTFHLESLPSLPEGEGFCHSFIFTCCLSAFQQPGAEEGVPAGSWNEMILKAHSTPKHSMILWSLSPQTTLLLQDVKSKGPPVWCCCEAFPL